MLKHVLIIESDHDTRVAFRRTFEAAGVLVYSATTTSEGWRLLETIALPHVVVAVAGRMDPTRFLDRGAAVFFYSPGQDLGAFCADVVLGLG